MKLFEIPVYAISKKKLEKRVEQARQKTRNSFIGQNASEDHIKQCVEQTVFPQCLWDYNHIIGYIVVIKQKNDIVLNWYAPLPSIQRYRWRTQRKLYLQNTHLNGYHFYLGNLHTGEQLRTKLNDMIEGYANELKKRKYYADLEVFKNLDSLLNYNQLLEALSI